MIPLFLLRRYLFLANSLASPLCVFCCQCGEHGLVPGLLPAAGLSLRVPVLAAGVAARGVRPPPGAGLLQHAGAVSALLAHHHRQHDDARQDHVQGAAGARAGLAAGLAEPLLLAGGRVRAPRAAAQEAGLCRVLL